MYGYRNVNALAAARNIKELPDSIEKECAGCKSLTKKAQWMALLSVSKLRLGLYFFGGVVVEGAGAAGLGFVGGGSWWRSF